MRDVGQFGVQAVWLSGAGAWRGRYSGVGRGGQAEDAASTRGLPELRRTGGGWNPKRGAWQFKTEFSIAGGRQVLSQGGLATACEAEETRPSRRFTLGSTAPDIWVRMSPSGTGCGW